MKCFFTGKFIRLLVLTLIVLSLLPIGSVSAEPYSIIGDQVVLSTAKGDMIVTPHTLTSSGWVEVKFLSRSFTGDVDIALGFNGYDQVQTTKAQSYQSYEHTLSRQVPAVIEATLKPDKIISIKTDSKSIATIGDNALNTYVADITYEITDEMYGISTYTETIAYNSYNALTGEITYKYNGFETEYYKETFLDWKPNASSISSDYVSYLGSNKWQSAKYEQSVSKDIWYTARFWVDIPFNNGNLVEGKYNVSIKPSTLSLSDAISTSQIITLDPWYSASWTYRKSYAISRASGAVTDYQFPLKIYYADGTDGTESIDGITAGKMYCNSHSQVDFDDIRVTNSAGTLLDYWVETVTASTSEIIWIEHDSIGVGATTFYVYYGNSGASSVSNGANTFILFEDFEWGNDGDNIETSGGSMTWDRTVGATNLVDIDTAQKYGGTRSMRLYRNAIAECAVNALYTFNDNISVRLRFRKDDAASTVIYMSNTDVDHVAVIQLNATEDIYYRQADGTHIDTGSNMTINQWELAEFKNFDWTNGLFDLWWNGVLVKSSTPMWDYSLANNYMYARLDTQTATVWWDDIIVRNFRATEPAWGAWGSQESTASVTTNAALNITSSTVTMNGTVTATGNLTVTGRGFAWGTSSNATLPTQGESPPATYTSNWTEYGTFVVGNYTSSGNITGLLANTTYYGRAYVYSEAGWAWGGEVSFTTTAITTDVTVSTWHASSLGNTYAVINGEVTYLLAGTTVLERGFDYGITTAFGSAVTDSGVFGTGAFSEYLSGLTKGTTYYYRAKARIAAGWVYGLTKSFSTRGSPSKYEFLESGGDGDSTWIQSNNITAQTFYPTTSHSVTSVWLNLKRVGTTPGYVYLDIKTTSNSTAGEEPSCWSWPTGEPLTTAYINGDAITTSYQWWEFVFDEVICLSANTTYSIVLRAPTGDISNYILWQHDAGGGTGIVGNEVYSSNGGISWTTACPADLLYTIWGEPCLEVIGAKVFLSYVQTGDWLVVCHYKNFYPPYYDDAGDVAELFVLQLVDGSTVIAETPLKQWGYVPGAIYLNSSQVTSFEWGHDYKVRVAGQFSPYPYMEYQLVAADWTGDDLIWLDRYCLSIAVLMEDYYSTDTVNYVLTEMVSGKGLVLNEEGGVIFDAGIPALSDIRPDLFLIVTDTSPYTQPEAAHTLQQEYIWETRLGPYLSGAFENMGSIFSVSGSTMAAVGIFILFAVVVAFSFAPGHAIGAIAIAFPLLLIAWWIGVWPLVALAVILAIVTLVLVWQYVFRGG